MRRLLAVAALLAAAVVPLADPAWGETPLSAGAESGIGRPGDPLTVFGTGWPAGDRVNVSICGNQALNGSVDCDLDGSRSVVTDDKGSFRMDMEVVQPPEACPCVLFFTARGTTETVRFPFEVTGAPLAPTAHATPLTTPVLVVEQATVEGRGPWSSWLGATAGRTLVLTIENTSSEPVVPELDVAWGKGSDPTRILDLDELAEIDPGESRTFRLPFELEPLSLGRYTIAGEVSGPGGPVEFRASAATYPWAWIALPVVLLQAWLARRWLRSRRAPGAPRGDEPGEPEIDERASEVDVGDVQIDLREPAVVEEPTNVRSQERPDIGTPAATVDAPDALNLDEVTAAAAIAVAERDRALRAGRVAEQLAEAVVARASARSAVLLDDLEADRARASEALAAALEKAEDAVRDARRRANEIESTARQRAEQMERTACERAIAIESAAVERAAMIESEARQRAIALGRDPVGQAIRRAVSTALDS